MSIVTTSKIWGEAYRQGAPRERAILLFDKLWGSAGSLQQVLRSSAENVMQRHSIPTAIRSTGWTDIAFPSPEEEPYFYLGIYAVIGLSAGLVGVCTVLTQYIGGLRASRLMFELLLKNVVRATMRWYDTTPQGRLLNRFSKVKSSSCRVLGLECLFRVVGHRNN